MKINVFGQTAKRIGNVGGEEVKYGKNGQPTSQEGKRLLKEKYAYLLKMSDSELMSIMWERGGLSYLDNVGAGYLKKRLQTHYQINSGKELSVDLNDTYWVSSRFNDRSNILKNIKDTVIRTLENERWSQFKMYFVDCSSILDSANINFRIDFVNPAIAIPMGGIQEVSLRTVKTEMRRHIYEKVNLKGPRLMDFSLPTQNDYLITLEVKLRDHFAVDTGDYAANDWINQTGKSLVTELGREALAAFWILQHQRGYKPFKWNAVFQSTIRINQPINR